MFDFFLPSYVKKGKHLLQGVKKFLHYHRDLMPEGRVAEVEAARDAYAAVLATRDKEKLAEEEKKVLKVCERAVPNYRNDALKENIEVIIVAIVIALGIRAYFLQPFKIPTASMQPTLNGITATRLTPEQEMPNILKQGWDFVARGRNTTELRSPSSGAASIVKIEQKAVAMFFTYTKVTFSNGETTTVYSPVRQLMGDLWQEGMNFPSMIVYDGRFPQPTPQSPLVNHPLNPGNIPATDNVLLVPTYDPQYPNPVYPAGTVLARGFVDTGDQVLVDKVSYHFRQPKRSEVFVFSTRDISSINNDLPPGVRSQHYIKRLAGVPHDKLIITSDNRLHVNGQVGSEEGLQKVMSKENGYRGYDVRPTRGGLEPGAELEYEDVELNGERVREYRLQADEYFALGDNSFNSRDSRYWGVVKERNLIGPALMVYWPFQPHWWLIH